MSKLYYKYKMKYIKNKINYLQQYGSSIIDIYDDNVEELIKDDIKDDNYIINKTLSPKAKLLNYVDEICSLSKKQILNQISFNDFIDNKDIDIQEVDNYNIFYSQIYYKIKTRNDFTIIRPVLNVILSDIIKRLTNHNYCFFYDNESEKCNRNIYCSYDNIDKKCNYEKNTGLSFREIERKKAFHREFEDIGLKRNFAKQHEFYIYKYDHTNKIIIRDVERNIFKLLNTLIDEINSIYELCPYIESIMVILNYIIIISQIGYKNMESPEIIKKSYLAINYLSKNSLPFLELLLNKFDEGVILFPTFTNLGYDYFLKMGDIPFFIVGMQTQIHKYAHVSQMSPISYFYHDIIHAFHYYNHTISRIDKGFNIIQSNMNKMIIYQISNMYSSINESSIFYNEFHHDNKDEMNFRKKLSNNIKLILFFLIHEENIGYHDLNNFYDKLQKKTYHTNYTNEYIISSKILEEYKRDFKFETDIDIIQKKYYTDEPIDIFRKNLMLAILTLQYIIKNMSIDIKNINDNIKKWNKNELLDNVFGDKKDYLIDPNTTFTYIDDYQISIYLDLIRQLDIIDYKDIFSEIIDLKSYTERKYIPVYDILVENINKKDETFLRNTRSILVKTIIKIRDYNMINIINIFFDKKPNEEKIEFIYEYITNLYLGIEKKTLLFIELCNSMKTNQFNINIELIDKIILYYKDFNTISKILTEIIKQIIEI